MSDYTNSFEQDTQIVLLALRAAHTLLSFDESSAKIYHLGLDSYSINEIISEIEIRNASGLAFVQMLAMAALEKGIKLQQYLKQEGLNP